MLCYRHHGLIPISDSRFCLNASNPISISKPECVKFPTRICSGLCKPKVKACVNNGFVALESSRCERSFYELLGVPETGSLVEVKHAYKKLARKYHPDVSPPGRVEEYTKRFIQLKEAYETLSDPMRRSMYDRDIATGLHFAAFSSRHRHYYDHQVNEQKVEWKSRWQSQLSELKRRSKCRDSGGNMSWAAKLRQKRDGLANEL